MKAVYIATLTALFLALILAGSGSSADTCYPRNDPCICGSCPAGGYDRTPICQYETGSPYCGQVGRGVAIDPWQRCGAFCAAGQIPVGWPYNWGDEYWLRPDSNL